MRETFPLKDLRRRHRDECASAKRHGLHLVLCEEEEPLVDALRVAVRLERGVIAKDGVVRQSTSYEKKINRAVRDRFPGAGGEEHAALHPPDPARAQIAA